MNLIKMANGKTIVLVHPSQVESMESKGYKIKVETKAKTKEEKGNGDS